MFLKLKFLGNVLEGSGMFRTEVVFEVVATSAPLPHPRDGMFLGNVLECSRMAAWVHSEILDI